MILTKDKRFREDREDFPGPGTYELSPMFQDTVIKGTFNHTLNNPIIAVPGTNRSETKHAFLIGV
ncbi:Sperm-tail PG-rich repeat-containing protein 2 [Bulinus truncatus]|nr:Sperm-tail PG-rich repeat-containing protein 2 [Bulinus truncatus]